MTNYDTGTAAKKLEFLFSLYGTKYKEKRSFKQIVGDLKNIVNKFDDVNVAIRRANAVTRKVSAAFSMCDAEPSKWTKIRRVKAVLEKFALDIAVIVIDEQRNPFRLARRTLEFKKQWNESITEMEGEFLRHYGDIFAADLLFANGQDIRTFLAKLRRARTMPNVLAVLHDKRTQLAIDRSINMYMIYLRRMAALAAAHSQ